MNSIDRNQPEDNHQDLSGEAAIAKIRDIADKAQCCFFCTSITSGQENSARPMSVLEVDDDGSLWFLSASDSHHNRELATDSQVKLYFQASPYSGFLELSGHATVSRDKAKIHELWKPLFKTWFTGGIEDPRITVLKVTPSQGYYWDNKNGNFIAGIKMLIGATLGKTLDDSITGKITL